MSVGRAAFRPLVSALVLAALLCWAYEFAGFYHQFQMLPRGHRAYGTTRLLVFGSGTPVAAFLALALLWRSHARRESRSLALFLALLAYAMSANALWAWAHAAHLPEWVAIALDTSLPLAGIASIGAFVRFSVAFPRELTPADCAPSTAPALPARLLLWLRRASLSARATWLCALGVAALLVLPVQLTAVLAPHAAGAFLRLTRPVVVAALLLAMTVGVLNLRAGARTAEPAARRRLAWIIEGFLAGSALILVASALNAVQMLGGGAGPWYPLAVYFAFLLILAGLAVAMFFSGALDPALAIRRTAVFGLVALTMVFVFAGVENGMQNLVAQRLGLSDHLSGLISGGLVALTFDPVKERFNRLVGRWSGRSAHEMHGSLADAGSSAGRDVASPRPS